MVDQRSILDINLTKDLCKVDCVAFKIFPKSVSREGSKPKYLSTFKSYDFSPNLKVIAQEMSLSRP